MIVKFYDLADIIAELEAHEIKEIRVQGIQEQQANQAGIPFLFMKIVVTARYEDELYIYERPIGNTMAYDKEGIEKIADKAKEIETATEQECQNNSLKVLKGVYKYDEE